MSQLNQTIFTAVKTLLQGVSSIKYVYDYERADNEGYPCVHLTGGLKFSSEVADSGRDMRTWYYTIRVIQERDPNERGGSEADRILRATVADILDAIDNNNDLDVSGVLKSTPTVGDAGYQDNNTKRVVLITLEVQGIQTITM